MVLLPIVDRELRVAARRAGTYWLRFWTALAVVVIWLVVLLNTNQMRPVQMGHHLLNALGVLTLGFCMFAGVFLTSDCLSEEKREGTLGLLFLTDLDAYDVVLGKLAANSLSAFFGLLAVVPILGLTLLIGGVTGKEFGRLALVFTGTMFFSLSLGIMVSAGSHDAKQAMVRALLLVVVLAGVFPALWWGQSLWFRSDTLDFLLLPSPAYAYMAAFDDHYGFVGGPHRFWLALGTLLATGLAGIAWANFRLPRTWREVKVSDSAIHWRSWFPSFLPKVKPAFRLRLLNGNPFYWLVARDAAPRLQARLVLMLLIPPWLAFLVASMFVSNNHAPFIICCFIAFGLHLCFKILLAAESSRRMNLDRQSGALELLLVTPLPVYEILRGQKEALRVQFGGAMAALAAVNGTMCATVLLFYRQLDMDGDDMAIFLEMFLGGLVMLLVDFHALTWVGMWKGLSTGKHHRAVVVAVGQVMAIPWLLLFFLVFLERGFSSAGQAGFTVACWFVAGIVVAGVAASTASTRLVNEFRHAVLHGARAEK